MIRCGRRSRWTVHQSEHAAPPVTRPGVSTMTTSAACCACSTHNASAVVNCSRCPTGVTSPTKAIPRTGNSVASGESFSRRLQPTVVGGPMWDWPISASTRPTGWRRTNRSTRASITVVLPVSAAPSSKRVPQTRCAAFGGPDLPLRRGLVSTIRSATTSAQFSTMFSRPTQGDGALLIHRGLRSSHYHRAKGRNNEMENPATDLWWSILDLFVGRASPLAHSGRIVLARVAVSSPQGLGDGLPVKGSPPVRRRPAIPKARGLEAATCRGIQPASDPLGDFVAGFAGRVAASGGRS